MVPRYTRPEMAAIWASANRYRIWFEIEALAAEGMAECGLIPAGAARAIGEKGGAKLATISQADIERIDAIERETRHDVIAFLTWLAEAIGKDSRFRAPGHDKFGCAGHLSVDATRPGGGSPAAGLDAVLAALKGASVKAQRAH